MGQRRLHRAETSTYASSGRPEGRGAALEYSASSLRTLARRGRSTRTCTFRDADSSEPVTAAGEAGPRAALPEVPPAVAESRCARRRRRPAAAPGAGEG